MIVTIMLSTLLLLTGCTIEVVIREPIPVAEMMLHAGEDLEHNSQRVTIVPSREDQEELNTLEDMMGEILHDLQSELDKLKEEQLEKATYLREQI